MPHETTESLCPVCLKRIRAERVPDGEKVELVKACPEHGEFRATIWAGRPGLQEWRRPKTPTVLRPVQREARRGCPFDCGLCPEHRQRSCTVLLEVTRRCNLRCPVCFADARENGRSEPGLPEIREALHRVSEMAPGCNLQLSGGEPTVRDDLPAIVGAARRAGIGFVQVNTNGIRLAEDPSYVGALKDAGLASIFLQFDGTRDSVHLELRGRALNDEKRGAVDACARHGIGVVLVPTLVPGVNTDQVGEILKLAASMSPAVRGVHFQPVSHFGRFPHRFGNAHRITLPELMAAIEHQTDGGFMAADFRPPGCENAWCSCHADYVVLSNGRVRALHSAQGPGCCDPIAAGEGARRAMAHVRRQWSEPTPSDPSLACGSSPGAQLDSSGQPMRLDDFLARARSHTLTVSAMAFQDAWTLDLERLRECCIHVYDVRYGLVPFCAYNLTAVDGRALYR
jgi:7,8-dihydro-6-hydroxymethylpterin dimethyltransferase